VSKKSEYAARASECGRMADSARGDTRASLLEAESAWRRLARACFDTRFGPPSRLVDLGGSPFTVGR